VQCFNISIICCSTLHLECLQGYLKEFEMGGGCRQMHKGCTHVRSSNITLCKEGGVSSFNMRVFTPHRGGGGKNITECLSPGVDYTFEN